jgi:hypothetical protein
MWVTKRYTALRVISILLKVASVMIFVACLGVVGSMSVVPFPTFTLSSFFTFCVGTGIALSLWAQGERILVAVDTEENTRETALLLRAIYDRQQPDVPVGDDYIRARDGVWAEPPQRIIPPRQGPPPPRRWIDEQGSS